MKTKKTIRKGSSDFKTIIEDNGYFVDKTMLIKEFFDNGNYTLLMPRPKRFGKTLNLSMIEHFFDIQKNCSKKLFEEFEISKEKSFCTEHQNKYPLINISLKSIKETSWYKCIKKFKNLSSKLYEKHDYLLKSKELKDSEKQHIENIILKTADETDIKESLSTLSYYLKKHFNKKVIILVDEYDAPIISAFNYTKAPIKNSKQEDLTYYENTINFMQGFLGDAYKGNNNLKKGLLTGVMRVGRESIFSEWNNFEVYGINSSYFADKFGFTQQEVEKLLNYFNLQADHQKLIKWYDGYKFGNISRIYNPWSIVSYILNKNDGFRPYWVNTGDLSLIKNRLTEKGVKEKIQDLIEGKVIEKQLKDNFVFPDFETDNELIWTLLTYNGYLTQAGKGKYGNYKLKITNQEVKIVFTDIIMEWLNNRVMIKRDLLIRTSENIINNELIKFERGFRQIIGDTISYFDTSKKTNEAGNETIISPEQIYHVYTLGLLTILSDDYNIKSNRESFDGRYDIMLIPHNKTRNGIVIEIKQTAKQKQNEKDHKFIERINNKIKDALSQINRNEYYAELIENKIKPENIIKLAIVFAGKKPYINLID